MLLNEKALRERFDAVYRNMVHRAKPKLWKNGRLRGKVRVPGLERLPFTKQEFWDWGIEWIGHGALRCPYCEEIGRNAFLITLEDCTFDHKEPIARGGTWDLSNLIPVCRDCNNCKGSMSYVFFIRLMRDLEKIADLQDRAYIVRCLRTHGISQQFQRSRNKGAGNALSTPRGALLFDAPQDDNF